MKKFIFILCITLFLITSATAKIKKMDIINDNTLQIVVDVAASKNQIYERLLDYISNNYTGDESTIKVNSPEKGKIAGTGNSIIYLELDYFVTIKASKDVIYQYKYEIKDNKFRFTISQLFWYKNGSKKHQSGKKRMREIAKSIKKAKLIEKIRDHVENNSSTDNNDSDW